MLADISAGIGYTILITFLALLIGGIIGLPLAAARRSRRALVRGLTTIYLDVVRAVPPITWLFLIYFGLPQYQLFLEPVPAAILGLSLISSAYMAEIYRAGLLSIHVGQWEAAHALGLSSWARTRHIITPQAYRVCLTAIAPFGIGLLKDSALASTIGVREITYNAGDVARQTHDGLLAFAIAGALYVVISIPLAIAARRVDRVLQMKLGAA